jgi:hypothetical protein
LDVANSDAMSLTATRRPLSLSSASYTVPMPPLPRARSSLYLPMCCGGLVISDDGAESSPLGARVGASGSKVAVSGTVSLALPSGLPQYAQKEGGAPEISST